MIQPYEYTPANLAIRFELTCGKGCKFSAVMQERFTGVDRPEDEEVDNEGNEIDKQALGEMIDEDRLRRKMDAQDQIQEQNRHLINPHLEEPDGLQ